MDWKGPFSVISRKSRRWLSRGTGSWLQVRSLSQADPSEFGVRCVGHEHAGHGGGIRAWYFSCRTVVCILTLHSRSRFRTTQHSYILRHVIFFRDRNSRLSLVLPFRQMWEATYPCSRCEFRESRACLCCIFHLLPIARRWGRNSSAVSRGGEKGGT